MNCGAGIWKLGALPMVVDLRTGGGQVVGGGQAVVESAGAVEHPDVGPRPGRRRGRERDDLADERLDLGSSGRYTPA